MDSRNVAILVKELSKKYRLGTEIKRSDKISGKIVNTLISPFEWLKIQMREPFEEEILWAIKNINFTIQKGEVVGFVGHNGAGKSTLLKILSRITDPSEGYAEIHGRLSALLEVGTGMHPELTGRENIYMNGTILGMKKWEIDKKFDDIVDFSGISKFLDTSVKHYSSGMRVRLGFAIAAHLEPEILIVDEVLAVGDADFQKKSIGKMQDVAKGGRTVLFVSHNMAAIKSLCTRAFLMKGGTIHLEGDTDEVIREYYHSSDAETGMSIRERTDRKGNGLIRFVDINISDKNGYNIEKVMSGQDIYIDVEYASDEKIKIKNIDIRITVYASDGKYMFTCSTEAYGVSCDEYPSHGKVRCKIDRFPLTSGNYFINLFSTYKGEISDWIANTMNFTVYDGDYYGTGKIMSHKEGFLVQHEWEVESIV